jgi:hypothetical protein
LFQQPRSFRYWLLMSFGPFGMWRMHTTALEARNSRLYCFLMNKMDRDLPSCLRALRHVYRRGLDWFQQCQSFGLGYSSVLVHFVAYTHGWTKRTALYVQLQHGQDGFRASIHVCEPFGMCKEEVLTGSNSLGPFVWSRKCVLVHFAQGRMAS